MDAVVTNGLVIRQLPYGEADLILTIFTQDYGIVKVLAKGVRKPKSHQRSAAQLLCYAQYTLAPGRSFYAMRGALSIESFYAIGSDIEKLALAVYMCDLTATMVSEQNAEPHILAFLLNTLHILAVTDRPILLIKAVFELRIAELSGFGAQMEGCMKCGHCDGLAYFDFIEGGMVCAQCVNGLSAPVKVSPAILSALRYIATAPDNRVYHFTMAPETIHLLGSLAERFVLTHAEREFQSLSYLKNILLHAIPNKQ